jgi:hypothetical protein
MGITRNGCKRKIAAPRSYFGARLGQRQDGARLGQRQDGARLGQRPQTCRNPPFSRVTD